MKCDTSVPVLYLVLYEYSLYTLAPFTPYFTGILIVVVLLLSYSLLSIVAQLAFCCRTAFFPSGSFRTATSKEKHAPNLLRSGAQQAILPSRVTFDAEDITSFHVKSRAPDAGHVLAPKYKARLLKVPVQIFPSRRIPIAPLDVVLDR